MRVSSVRLERIGETSTPRLTPNPPRVRTPEPLLSTNSRDLTDGPRHIDSVTTAEADIPDRAEEV